MKLTTRGPKTAEAIRDRIPFTTHGALKAVVLDDSTFAPAPGWLLGPDRENYYEDLPSIDYVVISYGTPIAWHTPAGWYKVKQKFSTTTSRHQGNLYLVGRGASA